MKEYIEREALIATLEKIAKEDRNNYFHLDEITQEIFDAPAADVVERKRGRWEEKEFMYGGVYYDCSVCGESFCQIDGMPTDNIYNFCPNCGADMREVDHETD